MKNFAANKNWKKRNFLTLVVFLFPSGAFGLIKISRNCTGAGMVRVLISKDELRARDSGRKTRKNWEKAKKSERATQKGWNSLIYFCHSFSALVVSILFFYWAFFACISSVLFDFYVLLTWTKYANKVCTLQREVLCRQRHPLGMGREPGESWARHEWDSLQHSPALEENFDGWCLEQHLLDEHPSLRISPMQYVHGTPVTMGMISFIFLWCLFGCCRRGTEWD